MREKKVRSSEIGCPDAERATSTQVARISRCAKNSTPNGRVTCVQTNANTMPASDAEVVLMKTMKFASYEPLKLMNVAVNNAITAATALNFGCAISVPIARNGTASTSSSVSKLWTSGSTTNR